MALYSDVNQTTPFEDARLFDEDSVQQALSNLIRTHKGERLFHPEYGMDIEHLLFELVTSEVALELEVRIKESINKWEPRVRVVNVSVRDDPDNNSYRMVLAYNIVGLGDRRFEYSDNLRAAVGAD